MSKRRVRRHQMYQFICAYYDANQRPPSYRDIMAALGYRSMCGVQHQLKALEQDGLLTIQRGQARGIVINAYAKEPDQELLRLSKLVVQHWNEGGLGPVVRELSAYLAVLEGGSA